MIAWLWRLIRPGRCQWCRATISTGSPTYPYCSEDCRTEDWQSMSVY